MSANYSDELFTTQPRLGGSWAAGEMLTKIHKITINSALVLRILDQWPEWARLQTSYRPQLLSLHLASSYNNIFASLKVASHPRLPIRFGTGDWVMKIFAKRLCAMCNVNNVLQTGTGQLRLTSVHISECCLETAAVCLVWARHQLRWNKTVRCLSCVNLIRENTGMKRR